MASDFLKNMAQRQAEKIDKEYGSDAYGGSNWRQQQAAGGGTTAQAQQVSGASSFLRSQAQKARERVDAEYGPDAYGGSNYQFSVKPASSFAQIDETAPAFERYEQVAAELTSGQEKLTTSRAQLDTLRSAYDADPTEANATAYNRSLAQFQADLEAYNDLVDQYTYFNSLEGIQERVDELTPLVEAAEKERNEARTVMTGIQRYGTEDQRAEWSAKLEAAEADYERYSKALNDLAAQYYYAENQAKRESLDASEDMSSLYNEATMLQEDMDKVTEVMAFTFNGSGDAAAVEEYKKYLAEKYGLDQKAIDQYAIAGAGGAYTPRTDGGYNNIYELYQELEAKKKQAVERMAAEEYDYDRMAQFEQMQRDAEEYEKSVQEWETWAKEHPILSSAETVLVSPFQGIDYLKTMVGGIGTSDPSNLQTYVPVNVYNMDATNFVSTVRGTVSKEIEENTDWELFGQNVASFLYQTGMSIADSAVQVGAATALGVPTAATFFMGASAASNQAKDVIERGGTNEQAFWGGLAAGAAEALFEKVSIDRLLSVHSVSSMKDLLKETVKQAGVEASEEMLTEISNIITDAAIMGDKSNFEAMVDQYEMQGLSEDEAKKQALLDSIGQVAWAGAGGALSGAAMGGVVNTMNYAGDAAYNRQQNQAAGEQFQQMGDDVVAAIIEEGLASDPSTRSYQLAQQIQNKQAQGQQVTAQELGELYQENVRTVAQEQSRQEAQEPEGLSLPTVESVLEETERADPVTVQRGAIQSETTPAPTVSPLEAVRNGQVQEPEAAPETAPGAQRTPVADILNGGVTNGTEGTAQGAAVQGTGAGVLGGDVGRISGTGTGGQTGGLEGSAGARRRSEQVRAASARQDRVNALQVTPVSSREMGLTSGTDARTVKPVPQQAYDEAMQATAQRFEQAGYTVTYFTGLLQVSTPAGPVRVNGAVQGSRVYIQADNMRWSIDQIGNHEQFHIEAAADPGLVEAVRDEIISRFSEEQFSGIVETYIQKLRGVIDIPENATDAEIDAAVRDILEEIFADAYAGKNAFSAGSTEYTQAVRDVVDQRSAGRREETTPARGPPEERYSFAGRNANRADQEALARAEEMERAGEDAEQIRQETGWFRGADGLWRFEIDDSGMEYDPTGDLQGARSRRWAMEDLEAAREDLFGNITEEQADMVRAYNRAEITGDTAEQQRLYDELTATEFGFQFETYVDALQRANATKNNPWGGTLADYINHPELFANYPQLRDVGLEFRKLPEGTRGEFDGDTVTLDESLLTEPEDVLIHEIQHAIQRAEGFARGASPEYWSRQLQNGYDGRTENVRREAARLRDEYNSVRDQEPEFFDAMIELEEMTPDVPRGAVNWDTLEQIEEDPIEWQQYDAAREAAEQQFGREKVWGFITLLQHLKRAETDAGRSAYNLYRDTAGEIEARDAAARRSMDREQRRNTRPNIGNEDTVFSDADAFANAEGTDALKEQQMQVIQESNPAQDDYHTWIRSAEEIKTLQEAITDPEWAEYDEFNPDYSRAMAEEALESGEIEVFSSYPIEAGGFVTPSRMEAESYAGDGRVYSRRVPVTDVAWIDPTQGQYAPTGRARYSVEDAATEDNQGKELTKEQQEFFRGSQIRDRQGRLREVYHGTNSGEFTVFDWSETQRTDGGWFGRGFYFTFYQGEARMYGQRVLPAYLNIKNPFVFDEQMFTIEGMKPETTEGSSVAFIINFAEKLPELAEGRTLEVVTGWDDEGYGIVKNIPWSELRAEIEPILNNPTFTIQEVQDAYRGNYYQWFLKTGKGKYDYSQSRAYYETKEMAEKYRFDAAVDFLFNSIYHYADLHMAHYYIEDIGTEFTEALKARGYDGVLQTRDGDEVVAFYPEQIKRVDNRQPTENPDIRYSVDEDTDQEYNALEKSEGVVLGDQDETYTEGNTPVQFTYAIVPAERLVVSNDEYGSVNPAYPAELQPRDRSRAASQVQIQEMSRNLNPRLLADSPTAQNGAPIIRGDGAVIGGNARTQAIIAAYNSGRAAEYEQFVRERGKRYGLDTSSLPQHPVLVRMARNVQDWSRLAQELNAATTAAYSTTEQAMTDAARMGDILDLIVPNDEGTINNEANKAFINQFIQQVVPAADRGGMTTATGMLSQAGLERAQYAVFARAYGDPALLARLSESLDNDAKNVTKALLDTAANAVAMRTAIEEGTAYNVPVVDGIINAVNIYTQAKSRNQTVQEYTDQASLLEQYPAFDVYLAQFIENNKRSGKQIRTMLNNLYDQVQEYGDPQQESIFGGEEHGLQETLERAISRYESETGRQIGRPDFGRDLENRTMAAGGGEQSVLQQGPDAGDPGRSRQEDIGNDEGGEPGGLSLPEVEPEPAAEGPTEPEIRPAQDYRERLREAIEQPTQEGRQAGEPGDLYRDESMTDEQYDYLNERWRENQQRRQRQNLRLEDFTTVDEYTAALEQRAEQEKAERMKNVSKENFTGTPALERLGVKVENSVGIYDFIPSLIESDRAAKSIRKEMRRAERRLNATAAERNFASGVAAGIYSQEDIPSTMNAEKVMELADYYWAERAVSADLIRQQRADINKALSEKMQELFKDSDAFKPSRSIVLNHRTPERNMLHIFGDERGAAINAAIFDPVAVNEAERIRFRNRMHDEVRAFEDSAGKTTRLTKEERAVVQQVIEGRAVGEIVASMEMSEAIQNAAQNIKNGEDAGDAAKEFSLDREQRRLAEKYSRWLETQEILESGRVDNVKVENAVAKYKSMFDQFYDAINDFLVAHGYEPIGFIKGYAPHIQPENNQNLLNKSLQAMGINTDVTRLPSSIAGLTADYRPNKRWNPYFLQRTSDITQYDIASAYESYVDYMSDVLYHTDDIMRVRQAANYFRRTYAPDEIRENLSWAEELRYRSTDDKAAFLRDHDVISKTSAMTPGDISQAMDEYVDKLYEDITRTTKYSEFVSYLDNYANILAGKQSMADRGWEYSSGRTILNLGNKLVRAFGRAQVAGNLSSALNQTAQLPQIYAELGTKNTVQAIADIWSGKLRRAGWAQESDFLTGKKGIDYLVTDPADMVVSTMFKPAEFMDGFVSTVAVRGKYLQEIQTGKSEQEAMKAADAWGKSVMGSRAKGSRPLTFEAKNPLAQMVNVFQVEAINSWEHLTQDLPRDFRAIERTKGKTAAAAALAGVIVKMLLAAFLLNRAAEETYGGTPAPFDILGLSANFIASGEGLTTNEWLRTVMDNGWEKLTGERLFDTDPADLEGDFNWSAAAEDFAYNASNDIPYLRNVTGLLGLGDETLPLPDLYGAGEGIVNAVANDGLLSVETLAALGAAAAEFLPGGRQLSKTAQGLETILRGGRYYGYGDEARMQYPVEGDFFDVVRALMFGNSALEETNEFYASGESGLSAAQTKLYEDLVAAGADRMELYRGIQDYRAASNDEDLSSLERGKQERDIIRALNLTDEQKLDLYQGLNPTSTSRVEKFQALMDTGMTWDDVMDAYDRYAELDADEDMKATDKATELARWADERYREDQAAAVKEQLAFFSIIPAQAERYAALTEAGLDTESAYNLTEIFAGLEPEEGSDTVTSMQRYRAVVTSGLSDQEQLAALGTLMGESEYAKVETGYEFGVTPAMYVQARENVAEIDENGSTSQDEATRAISSMQGLTVREKAVLWQLQNKSWKATNNPFDTMTGQQVYNALHAGDEEETIELPRLGQTAGETDLPTISLPRLG